MSKILRLGVVLFCSILTFGTALSQEKTAAGLYNEGLALLKQKDYSGGLVLMEKALEKAGPEDEKVKGLAKKNGAIAAYNAANAERKNGAFDAALALYTKGVSLNPDNSSNYEGIARTKEGMGATVEAVKAYLEAAAKGAAEGKVKKVESREKKAQTMVGKLFVAKKYQDAIAAGEAFNSVKEDNAEVHYFLSRSHAESGNSEKAVEHAAKALSIAGDASEDKYYYAHATQLEALGRKTDAIAAYKMITGEKYKKQAEYKISELGG